MMYGLVLIDTYEAIVQQVLEDCCWFMYWLAYVRFATMCRVTIVQEINLHFPLHLDLSYFNQIQIVLQKIWIQYKNLTHPNIIFEIIAN